MDERQKLRGQGASDDSGPVKGSGDSQEQLQAAEALLELLTNPRRALITSQDVQADLVGPLADWLTYGILQPSLRESQLRQIADLTNVMASRDHIVNAILYLEYNQWDLGAAFQQWKHDEMARGAAAESRRTKIDWNRTLDRSIAIRNDPLSKLKLTIRVKKEKDWTQHEYPAICEDMDKEEEGEHENPETKERKELLRINRWRHQVLDRIPLYPPQRTNKKPAGKAATQYQGDWWHSAQSRYLDNLYKATEDGAPKAAKLTERLNDAFRGLYLPGEAFPAPERRLSQITGYIHRTWLRHFKTNTSRVVARNAKTLMETRQKEELAKLEKWLDDGVSSSIEDAQAVEMELEPVIKPDGFPLTEEDFKKHSEDPNSDPDAAAEAGENTYPPPKATAGNNLPFKKPSPAGTTLSISQQLQHPPGSPPFLPHRPTSPQPLLIPTISKPQGTGMAPGIFSFHLPADFTDGLERDGEGTPVGPYYRTAALRNEATMERINIGDPTITPLNRGNWARAGSVVMAYYWTRQTLEDQDELNGFLAFVGAPAFMVAGGTDMYTMLSWFDCMARAGGLSGPDEEVEG